MISLINNNSKIFKVAANIINCKFYKVIAIYRVVLNLFRLVSSFQQCPQVFEIFHFKTTFFRLTSLVWCSFVRSTHFWTKNVSRTYHLDEFRVPRYLDLLDKFG
uniref:Uncharacterized protein n=1 Tax=Cacopsylla melanoneura TaxID=428564 RepID=A0A8D8X6Y1_9HEMI